MKKRAFTIIWVLWALTFVVVELWALTDDEVGNTLSGHWRWIRDSLPGPLPWVFVVGSGFAILWLFAHFVIDRRRHDETL